MKKAVYLALFIGVFAFFAHPAKAEAPPDAYILGDGKVYNVAGEQTHVCFLDNNCYYLKTGLFAFNRGNVLGASTTTPSLPLSENYTLFHNFIGWQLPVPVTPLTSVNDDMRLVYCFNSSTSRPDKTIDSSVMCYNNSQNNIVAKQVLIFYPVPKNYSLTDLDNIYNHLHFYDSLNNLLNYKLDDSNLSQDIAGILYNIPQTTVFAHAIPNQPTMVFRTVTDSGIPAPVTLILINIDGQDVIYRVN